MLYRALIHSFQILFLFAGFLSCPFLVACAEDYEEPIEAPIGERFVPKGIDFTTYATTYPQADYAGALSACKGINLADKSIAIIGGSLSCRLESKTLKELLYTHLGAPDIYTYSHGGYGYATKDRSFQDLVTRCNKHDIYILWCSTNDYVTGVPVGQPSDYTQKDLYNPLQRTTQCGGMNYCIRYLRSLSPEALIIGLTSLQFFGENASRKDGYLESPGMDNGHGITFYQYMQPQMAVFEANNVPYLYQWGLNLFTAETFQPFFLTDGVHMSHAGYFVLGCEHLKYLSHLLKETQHDKENF